MRNVTTRTARAAASDGGVDPGLKLPPTRERKRRRRHYGVLAAALASAPTCWTFSNLSRRLTIRFCGTAARSAAWRGEYGCLKVDSPRPRRHTAPSAAAAAARRVDFALVAHLDRASVFGTEGCR